LIDTPSFPGWESFDALIQHLKFARDHLQDSRRRRRYRPFFLKFAPKFAAHFAQLKIKVFGGGERAEALAWLVIVNQ
jgi:hypothetical protein